MPGKWIHIELCYNWLLASTFGWACCWNSTVICGTDEVISGGQHWAMFRNFSHKCLAGASPYFKAVTACFDFGWKGWYLISFNSLTIRLIGLYLAPGAKWHQMRLKCLHWLNSKCPCAHLSLHLRVALKRQFWGIRKQSHASLDKNLVWSRWNKYWTVILRR